MGEIRDDHYPYQSQIDAYGDGGFRFADMSHRGSLLCLPSGMHAWDVTGPSEISVSSLKAIFDLADEIDVLFIGTGEDISPLKAEIKDACREHDILVEGLGTGSAISTYNILLSEQRAVATALIAVERTKSRP